MPTSQPLYTEEFLQTFLKEYSKEEQQFIQRDLFALLEYSFFKKTPAASDQKLTYLATAGGPGACKSTVLETYLLENGLQNHVYTDPDQVALRRMNYTYRESTTNLELAKLSSYGEAYRKAYEKWRGASNYIAHSVLQKAFQEGYNIAHGTTSTDPKKIVPLYENLKDIYRIELLLCYAADETRQQAIQTREREQAFFQADPKEVVSKGKDFSKRFPIYFQFAEQIMFYWQGEIKNGELPKPAARWNRVTNKIDIFNQANWDCFCRQYHADLQAANENVPEALTPFFGNIALPPPSHVEIPPMVKPVVFRESKPAVAALPQPQAQTASAVDNRKGPVRSGRFKGKYGR